jgi:class 3 adenylate cyclase/TolB-like protein/tetratricopeptide (TPR) repeat protein
MEQERLPRKLVAVLYGDVVGYSRLMGEAEDATHRTLADYLDLIAATVASHGGRVVHYAGDAVLARFDAAVDALACAAQIQGHLTARNSNPAVLRKVEFRIGVNLGDVIEDRGDIYGDGVNVAARLQELAEPGEICISDSVRTAVGNRLPFLFADLGEQSLKNIAGPVRAFRVEQRPDGDTSRRATMRVPRGGARRWLPAPRTAAALALALLALAGVASWLLLPSSAPRAVTVAVLPLANFSNDAAQDYFVDGMTEALITSLARLGGLNVISRTSIMRYKTTDKSLPEIARELGATVIVEGSVQLAGDEIRITAQLVDPATDGHLWAAEYDRPFADVLRLQSEIARRIAVEVEVAVTPAETQRLDGAARVDPETYRAYLRGMYYLNKATAESTVQGLRFLHEAVERDPGDALAQAGLALGYATLGHGATPQVDAWPRARAAALRAIALDPELAEGYAALADVKLYMDWDWDGAEQAFRRANELSPSLATNHYHYAWYLALFDRWEEAIAEHQRARELDPLTPLLSAWLGGLYLYQDLGRYEEAIREAEHALTLQPDNPVALEVLGRAYSAAGRHDLAIETGRRMAAATPALEWELGLSYARAGRLTEARTVLASIESRPPDSWTAYGRAVLYAQLGELDATFEWLAYEPPHAFVPWVRLDPWLRPFIENDPRFDEFLARLRLPR